MTNDDRVKVTIDGKEVDAGKGELVIKVAQDHGVFIPRFCWHERMTPVGMCRMCLVEIEGQKGLPPACTTPVADGMVVNTQKDNVTKVQEAVLEFLLINHPLDCPVCDRGGECPLQDQTLAFGPGESRFVEEKRHFEKPIPISDLVLLDRERCIQCARCTRFADEIAGDPLIDFGERSGEMQVITYPDEPFTSYFSGNTVQICPVGALTATPYRFKARPWDLATSETSCTTCSVGCRGALQSSSNRLVRLLGVDSEPVNQGWLCDKGRFGYEFVHSPNRVTRPLVRQGGELVEVSWPEALAAAAEGLRRARDDHGPASVALLGGARGTNEDAYVWARFAKSVLRTDHVDSQLGDGLPAEVVLGLPRATIPDCDRAAAIVLLAPDLKEELPVLFLRVRRAAEELGVPLVDVAARDHGLTRHAQVVVRHAPGGAGDVRDEVVDKVRDLVSGRKGPVVVVLGRPSLAEPPDATVHAAAGLAGLPDVRFLSALRRGNVHGALDLGLAPGFLPGRVALEAGSAHFSAAWGAVPEAPGLDAAGILESAVQGQVQGLVILGADPIADFPDRVVARRAMDHVGFVVAVGAFLTESSRHADVVLPTALWGEKEGTTTNLEGRVLRVSQQVTPGGTPMADWRVATELALRLGADFDLATVYEVQDEIARLAPAHAGVDAALLRRARDGVVLPMHEHGDELVLDAGSLAITDASWEPIRPGTIASEEGHASNVGTGVVEATGTGSTTTVKPGRTETEAAAAPDEEVAAVTSAAAAAAGDEPDLYRWTPASAAPPAVKRDAYALRMVVGRSLYDAGRINSEAPSLAPLAPGQVLLVHPKDFDRVGVTPGARVRVTSARGSVQIPMRPDPSTPEGVAFLSFNQRGEGAGDLIDAGQPVTDIRVETLRS
ncbi:MAG TPA: NADH-quinone oxidoreductase subunit NuoG [Acidimicrobiia bacterium]|nr:NADH-quinone oxidoreductase subunit NuoG [Acidimicrobiia bacterium]